MTAAAVRAIPDRDRLIVALDVPSVLDAQQIVDELGDLVTFYKIGMQLQFAGGLDLAKRLVGEGKKVFLDSKLQDIDNTITHAVRNIASMGVTFVTVHGNGKVIEAAIEGRGTAPLKILSVTYLTSLDHYDLRDLGVTDATSATVKEYVLKRAQNAIKHGADGVIASGLEAPEIRAMAGDRLKIITPGIREDGALIDDQKRVVSAYDAVSSGADYIVVGRPITRAQDMRSVADKMVQDIAAALTHAQLAAE